MTYTLRDVAEWVQGEVVGDADRVILAAKPLSDSPGPDDLTVVLDEKYLGQFHASAAAAAVVDHSVPVNGKALLRVKDPLGAFVAIIQKLHVRPVAARVGVHPQAWIHPSATIGADAEIGPFAVVGEGTVIGDRCRLGAGVSVGPFCTLGDDVDLAAGVAVYERCTLGHRVVVHANSVIGGDGFGFRPVQGRHRKVPQIGSVEIGDDVEIGACSTIDRATFGVTRIGEGTKIDNQVQIAHNCQIGKHNLIAALCGIAGSCTTGDYVMMGGQVGMADHTRVGARTMIGAKSGVHGEIAAEQRVLGTPAKDAAIQLRVMSVMDKLPDMRKDIRDLKKRLKDS